MRSVLLCAIVASLIATASAFVFDPLREHVGALNRVRGVTREQLDHPVSDIPAQWFTQTLDHTDPSNPATYQQRFFLNDQYYNPAAPLIFLTVGGEGPADPGNVDGWWISTPLAQQFGAMQVVLEHRYYGGSMPNDTSVGGMQYLSSSQALADLASFHGYISSTYNLTAQAKWVVWGGSYSGALSAWAREKYPTLFLGSYATSAPVLAEADDIQYLETVAISLGDVCTQQIAEGVAVVQEMLTANATSLAQIQHDFNLCAAPASEQDRGLFMTSFSGPVSGTVQYNGEGEGWNIPDVQQIMSNTSATAYENLLTLWQHYNVRGQGCANMNYEDYVQYYGSNPSDARSWYYQTCTEFGWFQTSDSTKQPFGDLFPIAWFDGLCADLFGVQGMKPDTVKVNQEYGNNQIVLSNTILLNGGVDPVHPMGNYNSGPGTLTRLIPGTAHCADLMLPQMTDPQQLTQARVDAVEMMKTWWTSAWEEEAKGAAASTAAAPPTTYISFFKNDSDCTASPALYTLPFSSGACITSPTSWSVTWPYFSIKLSTYNRYLLSLHYAADCSDLTQETWVDGQGNQCNLNSYAPTYAFSITTPLVDPYIWTIYNEDNCTGGVFTTTGVAVGVCVPNLLPQEQSVIFSLSGQTWTYQEYTWVDTCAGHASNQEQALLGQCSAYGMLKKNPHYREPQAEEEKKKHQLIVLTEQ